ncbi:hypothetical protein F2Q68_00017332 [Brassica cretica]|uniref:Uncharacterized protein n=1 Tax=Brassica cretica TaxID=69181 RepID=A0A8S9HPR8_BRACR|nr:hypothetical protein F2Q68_00017332 [Brassica cretica]
MEETVRSVRLSRRARQSPKRPLRRRLKEETAEKEWSESGRRGGVEREGHTRKERETSDGERALSVVEEMERSEEQFVKDIEVTRQNGEPMSQFTTVVRRFGRGTVIARVFDDRDVERFESLSCFGSYGEEEVRGVEEVRGKAEMVGEGVGEREGAARTLAGKRRRRRSNGGRKGESEDPRSKCCNFRIVNGTSEVEANKIVAKSGNVNDGKNPNENEGCITYLLEENFSMNQTGQLLEENFPANFTKGSKRSMVDLQNVFGEMDDEKL